MTSEQLHSEMFRSDPRVVEARRLLREALVEHRSKLTTLSPAVPERRQAYAELLQEFADRRGGKLFFPYLGSGLGNGALVELADGSIKYDMITGIGVHAFGHSDPELMDAGINAALEDTVMQGNLQQNVESAALCRELIDLARESGGPIRHCFLSTSGATANENALKMLFQARQPADRMLAFSNCFAGRTLATSQLTDRAKNRVGLPTVLGVDYVPFYDHRHPHDSTAHAVSRLKEHFERYPGRHAGMIMELIQGEGGYYAAPHEFLVAICEQLRAQQVPVFFDEIQTFGRTSRPFAFQHFELDEFADIVSVGKLTQVCATLFRDELVPKPGLVSQTFTGSTSSIQAARVILRRLQNGNYFGENGRLLQIQQRFAGHFERLQQSRPELLSGPWGLGGMIAFTAFDGSAEKNRQVLDALYDAGVLAFSAGADPTRVRMLPPFGVVTDEQIDAVCEIIADLLTRLAVK